MCFNTKMSSMRVPFKRKWILLCILLMACSLVVYFTTSDVTVEDYPAKLLKTQTHLLPVVNLKYQDSDEFLYILVLSGVGNEERRQMIRETWLSQKTKSISYSFVIGTASLATASLSALEQEHNLHQDLLLLPKMKDSFRNLTPKVLNAFVWAASNRNPRFVMKCDDDSFVKLDNLVQMLEEQKTSSMLYMGFFYGAGRVKTKGKYREDNWVLCDHYLPYAFGGGYLLSFDLVRYIAANHHIFQLYKSEDLSVGTWLAPLKVTRIHDPRFDTEYKSRGCFNSYLVTHKQTPEMMREKYVNLQTVGKMCTEEIRLRYSYAYNWSALPSECCKRYDPTVP